MFVMTIDQRGSRQGKDRVPELLAAFRDVPVVLPFERSVGDEIQGVLEDPQAVVEAAMRALRAGHWYVGIGVGGVDLPLPASPREGSGPAFVLARQGVDAAKKAGERVPLSVRSEPDDSLRSTTAGQAGSGRTANRHATAAEAVLVLVGDLVRRRTEAEWRVLDALDCTESRRQVKVAKTLGISPQAVSKAVLRSGWQEEQRGRAAAELLLSQAVSLLDPVTALSDRLTTLENVQLESGQEDT